MQSLSAAASPPFGHRRAIAVIWRAANLRSRPQADRRSRRLPPVALPVQRRGVDTGIGHTAGVIPDKMIDERKAAVDLVDDVRRTERGMAACLPHTLSQQTYDAVIAFAFNVGVRRSLPLYAGRAAATASVAAGLRSVTTLDLRKRKENKGLETATRHGTRTVLAGLPHHDEFARQRVMPQQFHLICSRGFFDALSTMRRRGPLAPAAI